jgi:SpoVK/Ycf46/Vps4 family AAA+-type ATPase
VFIDEIDAVAPSRGSDNQHQTQTEMVNQFLTEIGQINQNEANIVVVAATNRINQIDDALLRSGRLTREVEVPYPDAESRKAIFDTHLDAPRADGVDVDTVGELSEGLSAADMEAVTTQAARQALVHDRAVTMVDIKSAIDELQ